MFIPVKEDRRLRVFNLVSMRPVAAGWTGRTTDSAKNPRRSGNGGDIAQHRFSIPYSGIEHRSVPIDELAVIRQDGSTPFEEVFLERNEIRRRGLL
jgi:hypothetical protein